jgi:hypothetical protein
MRLRLTTLLLLSMLFTTACVYALDGEVEANVNNPIGTGGETIPVQPRSVRIVYIDVNRNIALYDDANKGFSTEVMGGNVIGLQLSDDGRYIAYVILGDEVWVKDLLDRARPVYPLINSQFLARLQTDPNTTPRIAGLAFIPNQPFLLVAIQVTGGPGGTDVYRVDVSNPDSVPARILPPGQAGVMHYSPNGDWFVLSLPNELVLSSDSFIDAIQLFDDYPPFLALGSRGGPDIVWAEDSTHFYVSAPIYQDGTLMGASRLWRVAVPGGGLTAEFDYVAPLFHRAYVSPRGTRVAIVFEAENMLEITIARDDGQRVFLTYPITAAGFIGWRPAPENSRLDSECFVYWLEEPLAPSLACDDGSHGPLVPSRILEIQSFRWVDSDRILYRNEANHLIYQDVNLNVIADIDNLFNPTILPGFDFSR